MHLLYLMISKKTKKKIKIFLVYIMYIIGDNKVLIRFVDTVN